ncbi:hypothetical protein [Streptomyces pristinaespiralis]|uniref:hypothetical protein n=1 Tax=Streptomyces pristinaespiralis TaxID=38300 RepID=UPI0038390677
MPDLVDPRIATVMIGGKWRPPPEGGPLKGHDADGGAPASHGTRATRGLGAGRDAVCAQCAAGEYDGTGLQEALERDHQVTAVTVWGPDEADDLAKCIRAARG